MPTLVVPPISLMNKPSHHKNRDSPPEQVLYKQLLPPGYLIHAYPSIQPFIVGAQSKTLNTC
jgi:hypothetical protein